MVLVPKFFATAHREKSFLNLSQFFPAQTTKSRAITRLISLKERADVVFYQNIPSEPWESVKEIFGRPFTGAFGRIQNDPWFCGFEIVLKFAALF